MNRACGGRSRPARVPTRALLTAVAALATGPGGAASPEGGAPPSTAGTVAVVDDAGRRVVLPGPARTVIALAPNLTEFVHAVGAGDALVAADRASNHPPSVERLPRVGDHARLDVERVLSLRPDLVLAWHRGSPGRDLHQLEAAGIAVARFEPRRLADIPSTAERIGALLGRDTPAAAFARDWAWQLSALRTAHARSPTVDVFFQVWPQPTMTVNGEHVISDVIGVCGGRNVFAGLGPRVPTVSVEAVVAARPEVLLTATPSGSPLEAVRDPVHADFAGWRRFASLPAVAHGWMFTLPGDLITRPGPRLLDAARLTCDVLAQVRRERGARP